MGTSTTLSVVLGVVVLGAVAVAALAVIVERARRVQRMSSMGNGRSRRHELHWTAIRFRNQGLQGTDLQEAVCRQANCAPREADAAIFRVGADL
ncbi:MAG: hypothetical protein R2770_12655 [Acidimicrobiales bacterium]|nr:hypothetical protein [Acidimicrobiales bacterium]